MPTPFASMRRGPPSFGLEYESVSDVAFAAQGKKALIGTSPQMGQGRAGAARVFDAASGKLELEQFGPIRSLAVSADGSRFLDNQLAVWSVAKDDMQSWVRGIQGSAVAFMPGEQSALLSTYAGPILQVGLKGAKEEKALMARPQGAGVLSTGSAA